MNRSSCTFAAILISLVVACVAAGESSLTIYNDDFAVVREQLPLDLKQGTNEVRVTDITARMEPDSVILRDPQSKRVLQILEQNYRADPVSQGLLLSRYEGYEIDFLVRKEGRDDRIVRGKVVRSGYDPKRPVIEPYATIMGRYEYAESETTYAQWAAGQPIIEVDGKLRFSLPGEPLFPSLLDDTILKPMLQWVLQTDVAGKLDAELSYVTGGLSWEADYSMVAPSEGDAIDMIGWVTMDNQSGRTFENARIKLMAGDVSRIRGTEMGLMGGMGGVTRAAVPMVPPVSEKTFDEYHLYTLSRPATLYDRETKQVEFLRAEGVQAQRLYVYDGARIDARMRRVPSEDLRNNRDYGTQSNPKVRVMREFKNSTENHLGIPLPKGRMRFYRRGDDGQLEFVGENTIDHTPRDETVRVYTGDAFDLVGERRRVDYRLDTERNWLDESFEIKVRNRKEQGSVEVRLVEHPYRWSTWEIAEKSDPFTKTDSQTIEFRVQVPAGQEKTITYKAHYTW
jgi:hypothetical protein